jgi:hypothetical protein
MGRDKANLAGRARDACRNFMAPRAATLEELSTPLR